MDTSRLFKKNPHGSTRRPMSTVSQKLVAKSERPSNLASENPKNNTTVSADGHASVNFPGLSFIDVDVPAYEKQKTKVEKKAFSSIENIECGPKKRLFTREVDSPTKSLQLESCDVNNSKTLFYENSDLRRSSLCILALKTAAAKATSTPFLKSSEQSSLSSMISLPGVPPVQGVNEVSQVQLNRQKSKKVHKITASPRLQSEEDLILNMQRKQEFKSMNQAKLKEESDILHNIRKREMIDKINKGTGVEKREKEEKKKIHDQFGIASGILNTRNLLLAPITNVINQSDKDLLIPDPESDHPLQRRIVRRVVNAQLYMPPEMVVQAETRFSESPFVQECLEWHNNYRRKHLAPDLTLDPPLCATAQHWANLLAHKDEFYYQNPPDLGENLFAWLPPMAQNSVNLLIDLKKKKPDVSGEDATVYWYKSHVNYDYEKDPKVLHTQNSAPFSQIVWHSTTKFGCGKARSRSGKVVAVAYYEPKGNIPGSFHENVMPRVIEPESEEDQDQEISENNSKKFFRCENFIRLFKTISCQGLAN